MMITIIILAVISFFVGIIMNAPTVFLDNMALLYGYIYDISNVFGYLSSFVHLNMIVRMIALIVTIDNFQFFVDFINWIWKKIPVFGGS